MENSQSFKLFALLCWVAVLTLFVRMALIAVLPISLYVDEAQYWTWSQNLDWGYFSKPPMVALLIFCSTALFGSSVLGVKILAMSLYPLSSLLVFALARQLKFSASSAFWAGLLSLFLPIFTWLGLVVSTDSLLVVFWALALYFLIGALKNHNWGNWLCLGLCIGLGLLTKYSMAVFIFSAFFYFLFFQRSILCSVKPYVALLFSCFIFLPNILWNMENHFPTLKHTAEITIEKKVQGGLFPFLEFIFSQWFIAGMVLSSTFILMIFNQKNWQNKTFQLLFSFSLPFWLIVALQAYFKQANANWAAPAFLSMVLAAVFFLENKKKWLYFALIVELLIAGLAYSWQAVLPFFTQNQKIIHAPYARAQSWKELSDSLRVVLNQNAPNSILVAENRTIIAHLSYELRDLNLKILAWNPKKTARDYYQMQSNLNEFKNQTMLFLSFDPIAVEKFEPYFQKIEKKDALSVENHQNYPKRILYLQKMEGFRGY